MPVWEDCDDADPAIRSAAALYEDIDGDGLGGASVERCPADGLVGVAGDCDDAAAAVGAASAWYADVDGDGHAAMVDPTVACDAPGTGWQADLGDDCNEGEATIHPGAAELCDDIDQDCDARVDECDAERLDRVIEGFESDQLGTWAPAFADVDGDGRDDLTVPMEYSVTTLVVYGGTFDAGRGMIFDIGEQQIEYQLGTNGAVVYGELEATSTATAWTISPSGCRRPTITVARSGSVQVRSPGSYGDPKNRYALPGLACAPSS